MFLYVIGIGAGIGMSYLDLSVESALCVFICYRYWSRYRNELLGPFCRECTVYVCMVQVLEEV